MSPALAVVNLARIEVVRKWDYRHFGAQCLLVALLDRTGITDHVGLRTTPTFGHTAPRPTATV